MRGHDHETIATPVSDHMIALDREVELKLREILRVAALRRHGQHQPLGSALVVTLVARVPSHS
jgi:hypothetical protein